MQIKAHVVEELLHVVKAMLHVAGFYNCNIIKGNFLVNHSCVKMDRRILNCCIIGNVWNNSLNDFSINGCSACNKCASITSFQSHFVYYLYIS